MFHRNRTTLELTAQISNHMRSAIRWFLEPGIQIKVSTFLHFQRLHRPAAEPGQYHIQINWSTDPRCAVLISNQRLQNRDSITISLLIYCSYECYQKSKMNWPVIPKHKPIAEVKMKIVDANASVIPKPGETAILCMLS